jgi:hypothetical protein
MSCTVLLLITLEGRYGKDRTPRSWGLGLIHPSSTHPWPILDLASTQPRPTAGQQGKKADVAHDSGSFHCLVLYVTMVSRDGRPFPGHVATTTSTGIDKTSPQKHPWRPCLLLPYKRAGRGSTRGGGRQANNEQQTTENQSPSHQRRSTSEAISFVISLFL